MYDVADSFPCIVLFLLAVRNFVFVLRILLTWSESSFSGREVFLYMGVLLIFPLQSIFLGRGLATAEPRLLEEM